MNTIYWLSVLGMVIGYGLFILSVVGVVAVAAGYGSMQQRAIVNHLGILPCLRWRYFLVGLISTVVFLTV